MTAPRRSDLFSGRYLFHLHTRCTDGVSSVEDYFRYAREHGVRTLVFLEHIRREPSYDVAGFVAEVERCTAAYRLAAHVGFEARLLPDGRLDIRDEDLGRARVIGIAEHRFDDDAAALGSAFSKALERHAPSRTGRECVWVHPGLWFQRRGQAPDREPAYFDMLSDAESAGVYIERNLRYGLVSDEAAAQVASDRIVTGVDAHSVEELDPAGR